MVRIKDDDLAMAAGVDLVITPGSITLNGKEVLVSADDPITISPISRHDVTTVNLTLFVSSLRFHDD